jgi:tetratricopeptide (TPR) repeat protein
MTDPTPGAEQAPESLSDVERQTRIEQLLVSGLDEYFAGRLDHAVNIWTRVLFLDRANDRARAYIDRARRAQAEAQRETEALVHQGLQAFDAGEVEQARTLLTAALERGAAHEQALPVLHRIGLLATPAVVPEPRRVRWRRAAGPAPAGRWRPWLWLIAAALLVASAAGLWIVIVNPGGSGGSTTPMVEPGTAALPVPGASEAYLARAQLLFAAGKLPDALTLLDRVAPGDDGYAAAQALRGRVQRELLRAADPGRGVPEDGRRP